MGEIFTFFLAICETIAEAVPVGRVRRRPSRSEADDFVHAIVRESDGGRVKIKIVCAGVMIHTTVADGPTPTSVLPPRLFRARCQLRRPGGRGGGGGRCAADGRGGRTHHHHLDTCGRLIVVRVRVEPLLERRHGIRRGRGCDCGTSYMGAEKVLPLETERTSWTAESTPEPPVLLFVRYY